MDKLTPEAIITFLWVLSALVVFTLAVWNLVDKIKNARKPSEDIAAWRRDVDAKLNRDDQRIKALDEGQRAMCRGMLALLNHEITGNSVDKLKTAQTSLTEFLIDR